MNLPDPVLEVGVGTYVMSVVGRSKRRTLHQVGGCYRIPGVDYRDFVVIGDERPDLCPGNVSVGRALDGPIRRYQRQKQCHLMSHHPQS